MTTSIQLRGEQQIGDRTYAVEVRADANESVTVDLVGALPDGTVVAEGGLVLPAIDLLTAGQLLEQTLRGLAVVRGDGKPVPKTKTAPANAGTPWTVDQDGELRRLWTEGHHNLADLATQFARTRWAIRARLIHLGCDPESPPAPSVPATTEITTDQHHSN